jgi:hypothetical protein
MTALAFLMTIALGPDTSRASRLIASGLSALVAFATLQLFARHRWSEIVDAHQLAGIEQAPGQREIHSKEFRDHRAEHPPEGEFLVKLNKVWMLLLFVFGPASGFIFVVERATPGWLDGEDFASAMAHYAAGV